MILDDGGDATLLVHKGVEYEKAGAVLPRPGPRPTTRSSRSSAAPHLPERDPQFWTRMAEGIKGVTEETTTGVHRLYQMPRRRRAAVPGDQRQRLGHQVQVRQPLRLPRLAGRRHQARHRRDDRRQVAVVCGYGDVGKGCAQSLRGPAPRDRHRDRPDLRAAGRDGGLRGLHARRRRRTRPISSSPRPATRTSSRSTT
jgi:adenosylhomocysteinase